MTVAHTLKRFSPSLYRLRIFVIVIAVVALPFAVYYLLYVRSQSDYFTDRSFRKLATISGQIGTRVESAALVFRNTSDRFINPNVADSITFDPDPAAEKKNFANLKEVFKRLRGDRQITPLSINTEPWGANVTTGIVTLSTVKQEGDSSWLYLDYVLDGIQDKTVIRVKAKTDLNRLIQPFLSGRVGSDYDQFQNILITESETGRVIFQHDTTEVRLASLDKLPSSEDQAKKIELKDVVQISNVNDVSLAGSSYRLFSHPLKLSLPSSNADSSNSSWITSGLIKSNYFQTEAWSLSIPYTILIIAGFLVALLVSSSPFFKLVLAGPKDRFRPKDVYVLIFALTVVLAVATCFGLYGYVYQTVEAEMDDQVKVLASQIETNFNEELIQALKQLDTISQNGEIIKTLEAEREKRKKKGRWASQTQSQGEQQFAHARSEVDLYQQGKTNKTNILPEILKSPNTTYRYFDSAAWIDETGMQQAKWSVRGYNTQFISAAGRPYFDNIRKGRFYELDNHKFWLEPLVSRNTGRNQVEISMASPSERWTVVFDMRLISLMDTVLPAGYGYAIIENHGKGKVLFHSDEAHHLGEYLFQECEDNPELEAAIVGRSDKALTVRYLGEDHTFFVTPVKGFPDWILVTFRNKQPLRSVFLELLTSVTVLFLIYGFVIMAGFTVFYIFNVVKERRAWLWPSEQNAGIYVQSIVLLFALSLVSLVLVIRWHGEKLVWLIAGIGLFSGFVYFVNLRWGVHSPLYNLGSRLVKRFKRYNRLYVANASLLMLLVAILPAASFFKYAYESQITLFIKHAQYSVAKALAKREERIRNQYANVKFTSDPGSRRAKPATRDVDKPATNGAEVEKNKRDHFVRNRLAEQWDVYDNFFFKTNHDGPAAGHEGLEVCQLGLLAKLSRILPLSNQASIERRGLLENTFVGGVGKWEPAGRGRLALHLEEDGAVLASHLNTTVPLLGIPGFAAIAILLLLVPLFLFVNYIIRKVFALDVQKPASHSLKKLLSEGIDRNAFVVVNAPFVEKIPLNGGNLYLKALPSIATSYNWADTFDYAAADNAAVIALDHFDYRKDDPQTNRQKLKLMENLLAKDRRLLIFSSAEFSEYSFSKGENGQANGDYDDAARRAGVVISDFFTEYAEDTDDGDDFKQIVDQLKDQIPPEGVEGRSKKEIGELFDTLYAECAPREPLQRVAMKLLSLGGFITMSRKELMERILNQASPYYTSIWNSCSAGERQTLCHLAQDRLLSHRDPDLGPLLRRELIVREHDLHLFNDSFRQFVKSSDRAAIVDEHDKEAQRGSLWQTLKFPILVVMVAIAAFLFLTQQDLYSRSLALMTGLTTLIPAVFKVASMFHSDSGSRPPS